jgi:hypothetical protein
MVQAIAPATNEDGMFDMCDAGEPNEKAEAPDDTPPGWWCGW